MSKNNKQPMSLENLPQYIKSLKDNGDTGGSNLVGVGQIVMPPKMSFMKMSSIIFTIFFFIGIEEIHLQTPNYC